MKITYRPHLIRRLKERLIPKDYPRKILQEPDEEYFDILTHHRIAVKKLHYNEKPRYMVIAYDIIEDTKEIITIYPISDSELRSKVHAERWKLYEKN